MKAKLFLFLLSCTGLWSGLLGQCDSRYFDQLDGNSVDARIFNGSDMFWDLEGRPRYEVPKGGSNHAAFASSLWIGGLDDNGDLHVGANTYRQTSSDFFPGPYRWTGNYGCGNSYSSAIVPRQVLALADGRIVIVGITGLEIYDPSDGSSQQMSFPAPRTYARALQLQDGRLLIHGDNGPSAALPLLLVDTATFTPTTSSTLGHWQSLAEVQQLQNGLVLFAGVFGSDLYDPATGFVTPAASLLTPRVRAGSILLPNGQVLVAGGSTSLNGSASLNSTEIYDPVADTWTAGPSMAVGRVYCELTALANGEILISGGNSSSGIMEHYDPQSGSIVTAATIGPLLGMHKAALQPSGEVFIAGDDASNERVDFFKYTPGQNQVEAAHITGMGQFGTFLPNGNLFANFPAPAANQDFMEIESERMVPAYQRWQRIWKITKAEIDQFRQDFLNNAVDFANYPVIEEWPAHGDPALGEDYYMAPFVDMDMDGNYDPLNDGDYPCVEGDQALWWVYNDDAGPHGNSGGDKMGIQVKAMAYAYDCQSQPCPHTSIDFTTFYHLEITNKGSQNYSDTYVGIWTDSDLGVFSDDYIGSDTTRGLGFSFNGTPIDIGGYGANPPALGMMMLETPGNPQMTNFMYYENDFSVRGNPTAPEHYYNYLRSVWTDGTPLTYGGNGYGGTVPVNYFFPGDPGWCGGPSDGWSESSEGNQPFDRRMIQSYGPFQMASQETVKLDYAMIWARGYFNMNLGSVCELQRSADSIQSWYSSRDHACFNVATQQAQPLLPGTAFELYPNPSTGQAAIELEVATAGDRSVSILDQFGRKVAETVLPGGSLKAELPTTKLPSGIYLVRLEGPRPSTRKLILQR